LGSGTGRLLKRRFFGCHCEKPRINQNQTGFTLPGVTLPQGQDEVHASHGTTCHSDVSGSGVSA
jgi:hypothetical protein